jgi:hypothetical protein
VRSSAEREASPAWALGLPAAVCPGCSEREGFCFRALRPLLRLRGRGRALLGGHGVWQKRAGLADREGQQLGASSFVCCAVAALGFDECAAVAAMLGAA